ncbi:hypothetical protein Q4Q34_03630 [Flavivirga abyssicola]|uniref:hypothetical protein n=1 Tax=Flavivirga abyssicola TaxID=3063533 RepID=UPI0026DF0E9D|nr:hypothetical protein [Flavivirga sp. MEBiC07777]WVK14119.1 hypothetical protein Q4Q34_03630 [Flavivirga sp. MEBiC07777]
MKTSSYILIAFLIFFFGAIMALHIDSKLYEEEYIELRDIASKIEKARNEFQVAMENFKRDVGNIEKRNEFIIKANRYFSDEHAYPKDMNSAAWYIHTQFDKIKDTAVMKLANKWAKKACHLKPYSHTVNDTYAQTLFHLGYIEEAIRYETFAEKKGIEEGHKYVKFYTRDLERFKEKLEEQNQLKSK